MNLSLHWKVLNVFKPGRTFPRIGEWHISYKSKLRVSWFYCKQCRDFKSYLQKYVSLFFVGFFKQLFLLSLKVLVLVEQESSIALLFFVAFHYCKLIFFLICGSFKVTRIWFETYLNSPIFYLRFARRLVCDTAFPQKRKRK